MAGKEGAPIQIEALPVVENNLLRKEHVGYCMAIHKEIGDRQKVIYFQMGPDISTVLLTTNATEVVAIDGRFRGGADSQNYPDKYWDLVDKKPFPPPGALGYKWGSLTVEKYRAAKDVVEMFMEDLDFRKNRGYWSHRSPLNFQTDRLLMIELKRIGAIRESIKVSPKPDSTTEITFDWAYPGEASKTRKIIYLPEYKLTEPKQNVIALLKDSDCYYQKGLTPEQTYALIENIQPFLKWAQVIAIGYQFKTHKDNDEYWRELGLVLGHRYSMVHPDSYYGSKIDELPEEYPEDEDNKYGMKMHVFERKGFPVRKYNILNGVLP